ncbi:MAG: DUF6268 family outer membrane beta-barrel protein [Bacteroidota bacterium]
MNTGSLSKASNLYYATCLVVLSMMGLSFSCHSQVTDLARIEYTVIPQSNSENSISRFRALLNFPFKVSEGDYFILGMEYRNLDLDIEDPTPFPVDNLGRFQLIRFTMAYTFDMNKEWRFAAKTGAEVNSNFERSGIIGDDINYSGALFFIRDRSGKEVEKPSRLIVGLNYSTNQGRPFPLPVINYFRQFHPKWSYSLGTPKTNLKFKMGRKQTLQGYLSLDGFFSNIQDNLDVPQSDGTLRTANNISMTQILGGLGYEYYITKNLLLYLYGGHTVFNEIRLRDDDRNSLYRINEENTFFVRTGIKFKI